MVFLEVLDQSPAYAGKGWKLRELVGREPACLVYLHPVGSHFARVVFGSEAQHEGVGEWPALASEVAYVLDLDLHLFHDFPPDCILCALAALHKACDNAVAAVGEPDIVGQEQLVSLGHSCDYSRRENWVVDAAASGADLGPFCLGIFHGGTAAWAELPAFMPAADMESAAYYCEHLPAHCSVELAEARVVVLGNAAAVVADLLAFKNLGCKGVLAVDGAYELRLCCLKTQLGRRDKLREPDIIILSEIEHLILLEKEPITPFFLLLTENTRYKCHTSLLYRFIITKFRSSSRNGTWADLISVFFLISDARD